MSSVRFTFPGLDELKAELRRMPTEMASEAANIIEGTANGAAAEIKGAYPSRTGDLRDHLTVTHSRTAFGASSRVTNTSPHAAPFENGTQARHTALGANRGAMPPGHVFVPVMQRKRRQMYESLKAMLARHGLTVSGS